MQIERTVSPIERARKFNLASLANDVEFSIAEYKQNRLTEREKNILLAASKYLGVILDCEVCEKPRYMGAGAKLKTLQQSSFVHRAWECSGIPLPKNQREHGALFENFVITLEKMAKREPINNIGEDNVNNTEKLFSTAGELMLREVHVSSLYDRG